jgi:hypothetical protein
VFAYGVRGYSKCMCILSAVTALCAYVYGPRDCCMCMYLLCANHGGMYIYKYVALVIAVCMCILCVGSTAVCMQEDGARVYMCICVHIPAVCIYILMAVMIVVCIFVLSCGEPWWYVYICVWVWYINIPRGEIRIYEYIHAHIYASTL